MFSVPFLHIGFAVLIGLLLISILGFTISHPILLPLSTTVLSLIVIKLSKISECPVVLHAAGHSVSGKSAVGKLMCECPSDSIETDRSNSVENEKLEDRNSKVVTLPWVQYILKTCPTFSRPFKSTFWLFNGHLQTFWASLGIMGGTSEFERECVDLPDGGVVTLDWNIPETPYESDTPTVVILHGLTGGSHESYVQDLVAKLNQNGYRYRCVVMNARGCAESEIRTPMLYCGAYTADVRIAVKYIKSKIPNAPLACIGFSLGSNILVKYLGEEGDNVVFDGGISVSNPFDFERGSLWLRSTWLNRNVYSRVMAGNLKRGFLKHSHVLLKDQRIKYDLVMKARLIYEFDDRLTRVSFNYLTVEDYYRDASSFRYLKRVRTPLLCVNAIDDPISPKSTIPYEEAKNNPYVLIATTEKGGHIGYYSGNIKPQRWCTQVFAEYFHAVFQAKKTFPSSPLPPTSSIVIPSFIQRPKFMNEIHLPETTPTNEVEMVWNGNTEGDGSIKSEFHHQNEGPRHSDSETDADSGVEMKDKNDEEISVGLPAPLSSNVLSRSPVSERDGPSPSASLADLDSSSLFDSNATNTSTSSRPSPASLESSAVESSNVLPSTSPIALTTTSSRNVVPMTKYQKILALIFGGQSSSDTGIVGYIRSRSWSLFVVMLLLGFGVRRSRSRR
ncbi:Alpha/Beta hydrolase protein [Paraphysoderma sedebokerense]|nr:Alpha/Beta hydrolase protein [Paraphysoderma sedebokerense]